MTEPINSYATKAAAQPTKKRNPEAVADGRQLGPHADLLALQRSAGNQAVSQLLQAAADQQSAAVEHTALPGSGQPLDPAARSFMESRFAHDFSGVRVHTDSRAAESTEAVAAQAYTVGQDVVFGQGHYAPATREGKQLLAHELAHVVQQSRGGSSAPSLSPSSPLEQAADQAASTFTQSSGLVQVSGASAPGLARQAKKKSHWETFTHYVEIAQDAKDTAKKIFFSNENKDKSYAERAFLGADAGRKVVEEKLSPEEKKTLEPALQVANVVLGPSSPPAQKSATKSLPSVKQEKKSQPTSEEIAEMNQIDERQKRQGIALASSTGVINLDPDLDRPAAEQKLREQHEHLKLLAPDWAQVLEQDPGYSKAMGVYKEEKQPGDAGIPPPTPGILPPLGAFPFGQQGIVIDNPTYWQTPRGQARAEIKQKIAVTMHALESLYDERRVVINRPIETIAGIKRPPIAKLNECRRLLQAADEALTKDEIERAAKLYSDAAQQQRAASWYEARYKEAMLLGADRTEEGLELVRDASFGTAIVAGTIVAAPVVAGAVAWTGATGLTATGLTALGTGAVVGAEGAGLGGGSAALGSYITDGKVNMEDVKKEGKKWGKEGLVAGTTAGLAPGISKAMGVGAKGASFGQNLGRRAASESIVNASGETVNAVLEGKSAKDSAKAAGRGLVIGAAGSTLGSVGGRVVAHDPVAQGIVSVGVGAITSGTGTLLAGGSAEEARTSALIGGLSAARSASAHHLASHTTTPPSPSGSAKKSTPSKPSVKPAQPSQPEQIAKAPSNLSFPSTFRGVKNTAIAGAASVMIGTNEALQLPSAAGVGASSRAVPGMVAKTPAVKLTAKPSVEGKLTSSPEASPSVIAANSTEATSVPGASSTKSAQLGQVANTATANTGDTSIKAPLGWPNQLINARQKQALREFEALKPVETLDPNLKTTLLKEPEAIRKQINEAKSDLVSKADKVAQSRQDRDALVDAKQNRKLTDSEANRLDTLNKEVAELNIQQKRLDTLEKTPLHSKETIESFNAATKVAYQAVRTPRKIVELMAEVEREALMLQQQSPDPRSRDMAAKGKPSNAYLEQAAKKIAVEAGLPEPFDLTAEHGQFDNNHAFVQGIVKQGKPFVDKQFNAGDAHGQNVHLLQLVLVQRTFKQSGLRMTVPKFMEHMASTPKSEEVWKSVFDPTAEHEGASNKPEQFTDVYRKAFGRSRE